MLLFLVLPLSKVGYDMFENPPCFSYLFIGSFPYFGVAVLFSDHSWEYLRYYFFLGSSMWYHLLACLVGWLVARNG